MSYLQHYKNQMVELCESPVAKLMGKHLIDALWTSDEWFARQVASDEEVKSSIDDHIKIWSNLINTGASILNEMPELVQTVVDNNDKDRISFVTFSVIAETIDMLVKTINDQHTVIVKMDGYLQEWHEHQRMNKLGEEFNQMVMQLEDENGYPFPELFDNPRK